MDRPTGIRTLGQKGWGRALLMGAGILATVGSLYYLQSVLIAIAAMLLFGLAVPIYLGWVGLRQLGLAGLVVLLIGAGLYGVLIAQELRTPAPTASSNPATPYGNGGSVLQGASVSPYTGASGGSYQFTVTLMPQFIPRNQTAIYLLLFVSDCPGATGNRSPDCGSGYPFFEQNRSFTSNPTAPETIVFNQTLSGTDIWWWTMELATRGPNSTVQHPGNLTYDALYVNGSYAGVEGPVTGSFEGTVELILPAAYELYFLYLGLTFGVGWLVYAVLKNREAARRGLRGVGEPPPSGATAPAPSVPPLEGAAVRQPAPAPKGERSCPNCQAIVYPNETTCWKCGSTLPAASAPWPPMDRREGGL